MKIYLLFALLLLPFTMLAQKDTSASKKTVGYCMMVPDQRTFSKKIEIKLDTGNGFETLKDEKGKNRNFSSDTDALNFMASLGWELITTTIRKDIFIDAVTCYIFKRTG